MNDLPTVVWNGVGAECRELCREIAAIIDRTDSPDRPKLIAAFLWASWIRGCVDHRNGVDRFWDFRA